MTLPPRATRGHARAPARDTARHGSIARLPRPRYHRSHRGRYHPRAADDGVWCGTELFERQAFSAGLPPIRFHDLRHGAATLALAAGLDIKLVQERLGHSTSTLTRDVYTSVLPEVALAAAEAAAAMIPKRRAR